MARRIYLDNAATSQKPAAVLDASRRYYEETNSNIHRGTHFLAQAATAAHEAARRTVARHLNAAHPEEIDSKDLTLQASFAGLDDLLSSIWSGALASDERALEPFLGGIPPAFEPNVGQFGGQLSDDVLFVARGGGYTLALTASEAVMSVAGGRDAGPAVSRLGWRGAASAPEVRGLRPTGVTAAYFVGGADSASERAH